MAPVLQAFDHGRLFGARTGAGAPWVLALHGWQRTHRDFDAVLGGSGAGASGRPIDAIALDLPGFGASPEPAEALDGAGYAKAVLPVLAAAAEERGGPLVVLGHSFGGRVGVHLAAAHPDLVAALVLSGVPLIRPRGTTAPKPKAAYRAARWLNRRGILSEERMEAQRRKHGSSDYANASGVMRQIHVISVNEEYRTELAAVACPVELVWGEADTAATLAVAEEAAEMLASRAHLTVIPGAGHMTPLEHPGALADALLRQRP